LRAAPVFRQKVNLFFAQREKNTLKCQFGSPTGHSYFTSKSVARCKVGIPSRDKRNQGIFPLNETFGEKVSAKSLTGRQKVMMFEQLRHVHYLPVICHLRKSAKRKPTNEKVPN